MTIMMKLPHQRTGLGYDVHAFDESASSKTVKLFGVDIPHDHELKGHSDADVGLHAICDAIYGVCANGDIGVHFPPSDDAHKGQDSVEFLQHALSMLSACGGVIINVDIVLIGEEPKMKPHRDKIISKLAELMDVSIHQIGFKATTSEKLGFTGRKEGLACHAVVNAYFENGFHPNEKNIAKE